MSDANGTERQRASLEIEAGPEEGDDEGEALIQDDDDEEEGENGAQRLAAAEYGDDLPVRVSSMKKRSAAKKKQSAKNGSSSPSSSAGKESEFAYVWRRLCMVAFVVVVAVVLLNWTSKYSEEEEKEQDEERGMKSWLKKTFAILKSPSAGWSHGHEVDYDAYQRKSADQLYTDVKAALHDLREEILRPDYEGYVESSFTKEAVFGAYFVPSTRSYVRLKRRLMKKVLEANVKGLADNRRTRLLQDGDNETAEVDPFSTTFVWINAGHSAAAGHGNLINQTSPLALEEAAAAVFAAAGIRFYAKNYAMGGYSSRPELAFCMESIYGTDVDVLSWDFGMTDGGRNIENYHIWLNRAAVHPTRPILFASDDGGRSNTVHPQYDRQGMGTHGFSKFYELRAQFPDSVGNNEVDKLPPAVAYYHCGRGAENGEPCEAHKWNTKAYCEATKYQTSWHNGWKDHLFIGRVQAVYIAELLLEVVSELANKDTSTVVTNGTHQHKTAIADDGEYAAQVKPMEEVPENEKAALSKKFHKRLQEWDDEDAKLFFESPIDTTTEARSVYGDTLRGRSFCHSALLPSQFRYDGLVHLDGKPGKYEYAGMHSDFDEGCKDYLVSKIAKGEDVSSECPNKEARLDTDAQSPFQVYFSEGEHNRCVYPVVFEIDFPDFFGVTAESGDTGGLVPNAREKQVLDDAYSIVSARAFSGGTSKAMIMVCLKQCAWGRCPGDWVIWDHYGQGKDGFKWTMSVNGEDAESFHKFDGSNFCRLMLRQGRKPAWEKTDGSEADQFDIRFKVESADQRHYLPISSVIVTQLHDESSVSVPAEEEKEE